MIANEITHIRSALKEAFHRLRVAQVPSHALSAELLLMHVIGRDRAWLYAHPEAPLDPAISSKYFELVDRRATGIPTQYLTGRQEFWGLEFEVSPAVLIPRPETEHLVEVALERLAHRDRLHGISSKCVSMACGAAVTIADVGTGSGCIAIALANELPAAKFYATDISSAALEVAARNAARNAVLDRIQFVRCNLLDGIPCYTPRPNEQASTLDMIVSNPPYVARAEQGDLPREVRDHEPDNALYAGEHGVDIYAPLIRDAAVRLRTAGILVLELGYNSLPLVEPLLNNSHWTNIAITSDLAGIPRVLAAERL